MQLTSMMQLNSLIRRLSPKRKTSRRVATRLFFERLEDRQLLSGPTASFIAQDTTTQGNWIRTYGSQGYDVIGDAASLPSYATVTPATGDLHLGREHDRPESAPGCQRLGTHRRLLVLGLQFHCRREPHRWPDARPGVVLPRLGHHRPWGKGSDQQRLNGRSAGYRDGHVVPLGRLPRLGCQRERGHHGHGPGRGQRRPQRLVP